MTNPPATFGFLTGTTSPEDVDSLEAMSFHTLWVGGHIASRNPSPEVLMQLARLATLTSRARVGTAALVLPLYPPAIVAKQIAELDRATGGRVTLGVGVGGEYPEEFAVCGVPMSERGARADEAIPLLRRLWSGEGLGHQGRFLTFSAARIHPPPVQAGGPPIVVTGRSPAAMRRAARLGDGWMPYLYSPERFERSVQEVRAYADEAQRDLSDFSWMSFVFVNVQDRAEDARADATAFLGSTFKQDVGPFLDRVAAVGTPEQVGRRLRAFVDAGARHLLVAPATAGDPLSVARRVAAEIRPQFDQSGPIPQG